MKKNLKALAEEEEKTRETNKVLEKYGALKLYSWDREYNPMKKLASTFGAAANLEMKLPPIKGPFPQPVTMTLCTTLMSGYVNPLTQASDFSLLGRLR